MVSTFPTVVAASQFFQGVLQHPTLEAPAVAVPPTVHTAAANLVAIVETLLAPDSGWPPEQPPTPENLLPYVSDEVEELLEALHQWATAAPIAPPTLGADAAATSTQLIDEARAGWLWAIAASTPAALPLLEGTAATVTGAAAVTGVRLVVGLGITGAGQTAEFDLATQTTLPPEPPLPPGAELQLLTAGPSLALSVAQWQALIWQGAIAIAPTLQRWQTGVPLRLLLPGQGWQQAQAQLTLRLVPWLPPTAGGEMLRWATPEVAAEAMGMPSQRVWVAEPPITTEVDVLAPVAGPLRWVETAEVSFTADEAWAAAIAPVTLTPLSYHLGQRAAALTPLTVLSSVGDYLAAGSGGTALLRSPLPLPDLCAQVKWLWIRASQDWMPLLAGVASRRLAPQGAWQTGTLVWRGRLALHSASAPLGRVDISTGTWAIAPDTLAATDMLHLSTPLALPGSLWAAEPLAATLAQQVAQRSPLLAHLLAGVPITLTAPEAALFSDTPSLSGQLQLQLGLDFLP